jgi:SWI/SNF-related matrix-associated actin-dependent regulator 1 of chromatin subfamily A
VDLTKKNYKKVLRELDLSKYPSLDEYLKLIRLKLIKKESLTVAEELMTFPKLKKYFEDYRKEVNRYYVNQLTFDQFSHRPPKPYQETGVKFLLSNDRAILADDMGLGKSIQAVLASMMLPEDYKILIITTSSLKYNIAEEIKPYCDSYKIIEKKWESGYKFTIVHYESLKKWKTQILEENYQCVIGDEAHCLKNPKIKRAVNFSDITKESEKVWLLTGTPINNRPIDYFNLLKLIKHPITLNWMKFVERYCAAFKEYGVWNTKGASNLEELYQKTKSSILRRLKKDYLKDLPNKDRSPVFLNLDNKKEYENVITAYREAKLAEFSEDEKIFLEESDFDIKNMTKFILWRQYCALKKVEDGSLIELIETQVDEGHKIVVFTNFKKVVDTVYEKFGHDVCRFIDGRIDALDRLEIVKEFNANPNLKVLVCNLKVGSVGLNIQSADVAIINDMDWVPSTMLQAEDRLWRIGQLRNVSILYPIYKGTVEEIVFNVVNEKMRNISTAIEGKEESYFSDENSKKKMEQTHAEQKKSILEEIFSQLG